MTKLKKYVIINYKVKKGVCVRDLYILILEEILKNPDAEPEKLATEIAKAVRKELMDQFMRKGRE